MKTEAVDNIGLIGAEPLEMTEDNMLAFIEKRRHVTFVELKTYFKDFDGDNDWGDLPNNVWYWINISDKCCQILRDLCDAGKIHAFPTIVWTYIADGGGLSMPIAKRTGFKYKKPRWLPVVWNPGSGQ